MAQVVAEAQDRGLHPVVDVVASDTAAALLCERLGRQLLATVEQQWSADRKLAAWCYPVAI